MEKCLTSKTDNCKNCYKCIRSCPIKAISFENNRASIIQEDCVLCGTCYNVCPSRLKVIRNDLLTVKRMLERDKVIVSLAPSFVSYYEDSDIDCLSQTLKKLGFYDVEETAIGATIVKNAYDQLLNEGRDVLISSCCHSINTLIMKHYPECRPYLADVLSPMCAHGLNIKKRHEDARVVFIGPCIAKKDEGDNSQYIDAVLTFEELDQWLKEENLTMLTTQEKTRQQKSKARLFPTSGGIIRTMACTSPRHDYLVVDGMEEAIAALEDLKAGKIHNCFIEMSACKGSCVNGPVAKTRRNSQARNSLLVNSYAGSEDFEYALAGTADITAAYDRPPIHHRQPSEEEIAAMLKKMGKENETDRLNCGCCGYDTCRDKAIAILKGYANIDMCLPLLMEKSQSLANNIVNNTPNGLIVLDEDLNIGLINNTMCRLVGIPSADLLINQHVASILDPADFYDALDGKQIFAKREYLKEYERYVVKTISYDQKFKVLVCVYRDITGEEKNRQYHQDLVKNTISITDSLLEKNMRSVHEIASLLGETTAETKVALEKLKSLVKSDE
ncbi:MAG: 4Fe-4S dicluster domain-containing protein [Erysipelotrichaceae bacterium]|nr:4Fe-4S dicluster domain-containing protein [Erysipelotrichaceae bacterium]